MSGIWVRNGIQIKGQAMTYIQCHFCKSMVDADIFLLQVCATRLKPEFFVDTILDRFKIKDWLSLSSGPPPLEAGFRIYRDQEQRMQMVEFGLIFIVSVMSLRTNLGLSEEELVRLEMVSLLCMGDKTHSVLHEHMPEKCGTPVQVDLFDRILQETATYSEPRFDPASGNMSQGHYLPKPFVWQDSYDPIHVLLRAVHRKEFQTSIERFNKFAKSRFEQQPDRLKTVSSPWPPWRIPTATSPAYRDPRTLLHSKFFHGLIFNLLYKSLNGPMSNDTITSLAVYLLELSINFPQPGGFSGKEVAISQPWLMENDPVDLRYGTWYANDNLSANIRYTVSAIFSRAAAKPAPGDNSGALDRPGSAGASSGSTPGAAAAIGDASLVAQSMEIDQLSEGEEAEAAAASGSTVAVSGGGSESAISGGRIAYSAPLAITGPPYSGSTDIVPAS